jgi:hypothetical protein
MYMNNNSIGSSHKKLAFGSPPPTEGLLEQEQGMMMAGNGDREQRECSMNDGMNGMKRRASDDTAGDLVNKKKTKRKKKKKNQGT